MKTIKCIKNCFDFIKGEKYFINDTDEEGYWVLSNEKIEENKLLINNWKNAGSLIRHNIFNEHFIDIKEERKNKLYKLDNNEDNKH